MRIDEIVLSETTEEDRALVSLSSYLHDYITTHVKVSPKSVSLGKIGDISDTPVVALADVSVVVWPSKRLEKFAGIPAVGVWDAATRTIALNMDRLDSIKLKTTLTHELRHALDDTKSSNRASGSYGYNTAKHPAHRNDPDLAYLAEPAEINARFAEVLHVLTKSVLRAKKMYPDDIRSAVMRDLDSLLKNKRIAELFPEKHASRAYKRLVKRAVDFIDKEISHLK